MQHLLNGSAYKYSMYKCKICNSKNNRLLTSCKWLTKWHKTQEKQQKTTAKTAGQKSNTQTHNIKQLVMRLTISVSMPYASEMDWTLSNKNAQIGPSGTRPLGRPTNCWVDCSRRNLIQHQNWQMTHITSAHHSQLRATLTAEKWKLQRQQNTM